MYMYIYIYLCVSQKIPDRMSEYASDRKAVGGDHSKKVSITSVLFLGFATKSTWHMMVPLSIHISLEKQESDPCEEGSGIEAWEILDVARPGLWWKGWVQLEGIFCIWIYPLYVCKGYIYICDIWYIQLNIYIYTYGICLCITVSHRICKPQNVDLSAYARQPARGPTMVANCWPASSYSCCCCGCCCCGGCGCGCGCGRCCGCWLLVAGWLLVGGGWLLVVGPILCHPGPMLAHLGPMLRPSWGYVRSSWAYVSPSWAHVAPILGQCSPILGLCWGHRGPMLGLCWGILGLCRAIVRDVSAKTCWMSQGQKTL